MPDSSSNEPLPPTGGGLRDAVAAVSSAISSSVESDIYRDRILEFIAEHPDALYRTCEEGHLTGSALVVDDDRQRVLLMLHAKLGRWLQPGGHADGEGHLAAVALREASEETGIEGLRLVIPAIDCDVHAIPERGHERAHEHMDVRYLVLAPPGAEVRGNHESHALRWVTLAQLDELVSEQGLRRLARVGLGIADGHGEIELGHS